MPSAEPNTSLESHLSSCTARNSFVVLSDCIHYLLADSHFYLHSSHLHCNTVLNQVCDASRALNKKGNRARYSVKRNPSKAWLDLQWNLKAKTLSLNKQALAVQAVSTNPFLLTVFSPSLTVGGGGKIFIFPNTLVVGYLKKAFHSKHTWQ